MLGVEEDASQRVEGLRAVRVLGQAGAGVGDHGPLSVGLVEEREPGLDEVRRPQRLEGTVVDGQGGVEVAAAVLEQRLGAGGKDFVGGKGFAVAGDEGLRCSEVAFVEQHLKVAGVNGGLVGVAGKESFVEGVQFGGRQSLVGGQGEEAVEGLPGALGGRGKEALGRWIGSGSYGQQGAEFLGSLKPAMVEVGQLELGGDGVLCARGEELPVGFCCGKVEGSFVGAGTEFVKLGLSRSGGNEAGEFDLCFFGRARIERLDRGQLHGTVKGGLDRRGPRNMLEPRGQQGVGGEARTENGYRRGGHKSALTEAHRPGPPDCRDCGRYLPR